jgi:hypothetical protein
LISVNAEGVGSSKRQLYPISPWGVDGP